MAMKTITGLVSAAAVVAGIGGGAVAYQFVAASGTAPATVSSTTDQPPRAQVTRPGVRFAFAPCAKPSHREGNACVTDVVQTVVIAAPPAAAQSSSGQSQGHTSGSGPSDDAAEPAETDDSPETEAPEPAETEAPEPGDHHGEDHGDEDDPDEPEGH